MQLPVSERDICKLFTEVSAASSVRSTRRIHSLLSAQVDIDNSGIISFIEWVRMMTRPIGPIQEGIRSAVQVSVLTRHLRLHTKRCECCLFEHTSQYQTHNSCEILFYCAHMSVILELPQALLCMLGVPTRRRDEEHTQLQLTCVASHLP